jgi:26S proteasome regulatory subunit N5
MSEEHADTLKKPEKDYSQATSQQIEKSQQLIQQGGKAKLREAIDGLLTLEKQTRLAGDAENTGKIVIEIVRLCGQTGSWNELNEYVGLIAKKRTQIKSAITKMVQEAMTFLDKTPSKETKIELINALRRVSEGKVRTKSS